MPSIAIEVFVNSKNPKTRGRNYYQQIYGDEFGGMITDGVKIKGDVYIPMTSWVNGKCTLEDVKIPFNTNIISLSLHEKQLLGKIGDYELVKDFRISRGVYVSGLIRKAEHDNLNARIIIGYELKVYGRQHCSINNYKRLQKQKDKSK